MDGSLVIMEGSLLSRIFYSNGWQPCHYVRQSVVDIFFYFNGWQPCHYGRQYVVEIFFTPMDGSLVLMEGSLLSRSLLLNGWQPCHYGRQSIVEIFFLQWMVALSLCKVVCCRDFCSSNGLQPCNYGRYSIVDIFVTPKDGSLVIMEVSLLLKFLLLHQMVALSLWKVVCCRDFCYSNGWLTSNYGM